MTDSKNLSVEELWNEIKQAHFAMSLLLTKFTDSDTDRVSVIKYGFRKKDTVTALYLLQMLSPVEKSQLFEEILELAIYSHGLCGAARETIASMPREWVLGKVEQAVRPFLLDASDDDAYRRVLELLVLLDETLTYRFASEFVSSENPYIKEAGEDFKQMIQERSKK